MRKIWRKMSLMTQNVTYGAICHDIWIKKVSQKYLSKGKSQNYTDAPYQPNLNDVTTLATMASKPRDLNNVTYNSVFLIPA